MKFRPLGDKVLIKRDDSETKSPGGIVLPDNAKQRARTGKVLAVGVGARYDGVLIAPSVKSGDRVTFGDYAGTMIKVDNAELLIMSETDILGILEE